MSYTRHNSNNISETSTDAIIYDIESLTMLLEECIRTGEKSLDVQLVGFAHEPDSEIQEVLQELINVYPYGAWAVTTISSQESKYLSYYKLRFDITYGIDTDMMRNVIPVGSEESLRSRMASLLTGYPETLVFQLKKDCIGADIPKIAMSACVEDPFLCTAVTGCTAELYGKAEDARIAVVTPEYSAPVRTLRNEAESAATSVALLTDALDGRGTNERILELYGLFTASLETEDAGTTVSTGNAYRALCRRKADPLGCALAWKVLCDEAGIECRVVSGTAYEKPHYWNLVRTEEGWAHLDIWMNDTGEGFGYRFYCLTDAEIGGTHRWNGTENPAATAEDARLLIAESELAGAGRPGIAENED